MEFGAQTVAVPLGIIELVCIALYVIPRTSVLGAILLTGYLGGAIATQVRVDAPLFSTTLFPIYVALFLWGGLYFRDDRVRSLIPLRR
jgi:DoxX-like family